MWSKVAIFSAVASGLLAVETNPQVMIFILRVWRASQLAIRQGSLEASKPSICRWCSGWPKPK